MKVLTHYYPDKWSHTERVYVNRCRLEIHLIDFCKKLLADMTDKNLDRIKTIIDQEIMSFAEHRGRRSQPEVLKNPAGTTRGPNGSKTSYAILIIFPNKYPSFEICEPIP